MSKSQTGGLGGGGVLPSWVTALKPLVPFVSALVTIASNPAEWVRQNLGELVVSEIFDFVGFLIGRGFDVVEILVDGLWSAVTSLLVGLGPAGRALLEVPGALYGPVRAVAGELGIAAPVVAAFAVSVVTALTVLVLRVYLQGQTQAALDAIPGGEGVNGVTDALVGWWR